MMWLGSAECNILVVHSRIPNKMCQDRYLSMVFPFLVCFSGVIASLVLELKERRP